MRKLTNPFAQAIRTLCEQSEQTGNTLFVITNGQLFGELRFERDSENPSLLALYVDGTKVLSMTADDSAPPYTLFKVFGSDVPKIPRILGLLIDGLVHGEVHK